MPRKENQSEKETPEARAVREKTRPQIIAALNDSLRQTLRGGEVYVTRGIQQLPEDVRRQVFQAVQAFDDFTPDNDPYGEHDFGTVTVEAKKCFWKIDYYDQALQNGSEDPADPQQTRRVLTIMLAAEY